MLKANGEAPPQDLSRRCSKKGFIIIRKNYTVSKYAGAIFQNPHEERRGAKLLVRFLYNNIIHTMMFVYKFAYAM